VLRRRVIDARAVLICSLLVAAFPSVSHAETQVVNPISVDTVWTAEQGPYVLQGNVVVQDGATLTIGPGVEIYMQAGAGLTVLSGSLQATGSAESPIEVSSDASRLGGTPAPGDWESLTFANGAVSTRLDHVAIRHGKGLRILGSAPVLNNVQIEQHAAPAITIDLAASPSGVGNRASGNAVNAIVVPSGDIVGTVNWSLRGIPYLVQSSRVSVGASPMVESISPVGIEQGETLSMTLAGSRLSGLARANFSLAGLSAQVVSGTATQAILSVTAQSDAELGDSDMTLLVDAGEVTRTSFISVLRGRPKLVSLTPSTIYTNQGEVDVEIDGSNFVAEAVVLVDNVEVSSSYISGTELTATLPNQTTVGNRVVKVKVPDPDDAEQQLTSNELPLSVATPQLTLSPSSTYVDRGFTQDLTLRLPYPAPAGGATVNVVSSVPSVASVPSTVTVAADETTAAVPVSGLSVGATTITTSKSGFTSAQAQVNVVSEPRLSISPSSFSVGVDRTVTYTVSSNRPAGPDAMSVALASSNESIATTLPSLSIAAGGTTATSTVTTNAYGSATVTANADGFISGTLSVTVRPAALSLPAGALVAPSQSRSIVLSLSDPAPAEGLEIALLNSNPAALSAPATVSVPSGATSANVLLTGLATGTASITASASGYDSAVMPVTVEAVAISLGTTSISLPETINAQYAVSISRPAPAGGVSVSLAVANSSIATVTTETVEIPEGQTSGGVVKATIAGVLKGTTTLTASAPGLTATNVSVTVTGKPQVRIRQYRNSYGDFTSTTATVGKKMRSNSNEVRVLRYTDSATYSPSTALTVTLTSSDPTKVTVPATVTIPAGQYYVSVVVTGQELTSGAPALIDASASGYTSNATKLSVNVVTPQLSLSGVQSPRGLDSARDDVSVSVAVSGPAYSQVAATAMPIDLSIMEANPEGIIDGFYPASTSGSSITQVTIAAGSSSNTAWVGVPTASGTYKVRASNPNTSTATSGVVTVTNPEIRVRQYRTSYGDFTSTTATVGKGMRSSSSEVRVLRYINGAAYSATDPVTVTLTSSDPTKATTPATVTIPAGQSYVSVTLTGTGLTSGTPALIDASASGYTSNATKLSVNVVTPQLSLSNIQTPRGLDSARDNASVSISVSGPTFSQVAAGSIPIDMSVVEANPEGIIDGFYSAATAGSLVTQATIPAGASSSNTVYIGVPTTSGTYKVRASNPGTSTVTSGTVTVTPPTLKFGVYNSTYGDYRNTTAYVGDGLWTDTREIRVERLVNGVLYAATQPVIVSLSCTAAAICAAPATVTIPAGASTATFRIRGTGIGTTTLTGSADGYNSPAQDLNVSTTKASLTINGLVTSIADGATDAFTIGFSTPSASYNTTQTAASALTIDLTSSAPAVGSVPSTGSVASGSSASPNITFTANSPGTTKVTASHPTFNATTSATITVNP
jgi:hypothetical protein